MLFSYKTPDEIRYMYDYGGAPAKIISSAEKFMIHRYFNGKVDDGIY
jgi:hypothetical protein